MAEEAVQIALRTQMPITEVHAQLARARVLLTFDGAAARGDIEATLDRAHALSVTTGARSYEPQILVERARLAGTLTDETSRASLLREAHRLFTEMGAAGHAERAAPLLAELPR